MSIPANGSQPQPTAAQITNSIVQQLQQAQAEKIELTEKLELVNTNLKALRNVLNGIELGKRLQTEVNAEQAAIPQAV